MDGTIQNYTLDMAADTKKEPLRVKQYDTNSRQARITLKMGGEPWTIPFGCQIHINVRKTDGTLADATCTRIDEHTVLTPITEQMTAVTGTQLGELYFLGSDGDIKSQSFPVVVYEAVMDQARIESSDDFQSLQGALRQVQISTGQADIATQYATEQGDQARDAAQRAVDAAASIQRAVDAAANAKACESNAKNSELAAAQTQQEVTDYVEAQKAAFVGYSQRESDSKYANALTATMTGEGGVTVEDAWTAPVLGLNVAGKSEQMVTTGTNLFGGLALVEKLKAEANATVDGANRTVMFSAANINGKIIYSNFEAGKEYTIILYGRNTNSENNGTNIRVKYANGVFSSLMFTMSGSDSYCVYHTSPQLDVVNFSGTWASQDTILYYDKCGIFEGNIDLSAFEPYTGCAPSPSPDYPQDIINVGTVSTGAQMLNPALYSKGVYNGVAFTNDSQGRIILNGTATAVTPFFLGDYINEFKDGETYCLSNVSNSNFAIIENGSTKYSKVVLVNKSTMTQIKAYIQIGSGTVCTNKMYAPMLNAGENPLPWEPYTGGKPSPSVEYPQVIEVTATGANLFDASTIKSTALNGVTFIDNGDGSITVKGTATAQTSTNFVTVNLEPGQYRISGGNAEIKIIARVQDGETINYYSNNKFEVTISSNINIYMQIDSGKTVNSTVWPMLNVGDMALSWEPYKGRQTVPITLTEPLRGIGEYRDRIMCRDGVWGIERWITKLTLAGNEDWVIYGNSSYIGFYVRGGLPVSMNRRKGLCNQLRVMTIGGANPDSIWLGTNNRNLYMIGNQFYDDALEDKGLANWKAHLAESPLEIITYLDAPTWEPLPTATQQALNALTTYAGTTHLTITAGGPPAEVTLEYVQDTQKAIEQHDTANRQYTDNQIAAIVAALPTATQAAIVDNQTTKLLQEV